MHYAIKGFNPSTLIDWDWHVASIIYMPGCNFRCPFCHSSALVLAPESLETVPFAHIRGYLRQQKGWIDGVVIQGGEPTESPWLADMLREIKQLGLGVKLDTNGYEPETLRRLIADSLIDYAAMDIKTVLCAERYRQAAGVCIDTDRIRRSIALVKEHLADYEFRTTVVPGLVSREDIIAIAREITPCRRYVLQQFAADDTLQAPWNGNKPYSAQHLEEFATVARKFVKEVTVRGV